MSHTQRLDLLERRLRELELRKPTHVEQPIVETARRALLEEISEIGRTLLRASYWRPVRPARSA